MKFFATALILFVGATAHVLGRVRRDYKARGTLTARTVAEVWVIYVAHAGLTLWASASHLLPIKVPRAVRFLAGGGLTLAGLLMMEEGIREFRSFQRMSGMRADQLLTSGVYRYTRNPQNVGWAIALAGISIPGALRRRSDRHCSFLVRFPKLCRNGRELSNKDLRRGISALCQPNSALPRMAEIARICFRLVPAEFHGSRSALPASFR